MPIYNAQNTFYKRLNINVLNEAYFGTSRDLERIIDVLGDFRARYSNSMGFAYHNSSSKIANDAYLLQFNRLMEDFFGFYCFNLLVDMSSSFNGWTLPAPVRSTRKLTKNDLIKTKNGIAYKKEAGVRCIVTINGGLLFDNKFTDREVMAIILHEVGHNFSYFMSKSIEIDTSINRIEKWVYWVFVVIDAMNGYFNPIMGKVLMLNTSDETYDIYMEIRKKIYSNPLTGTIADIANSANAIFGDIMGKIYELKAVIAFMAPGVLVNELIWKLGRKLLSLPWQHFGLSYFANYKNEKIADSFPSMYGLGSDLASAFNKIDYVGHKNDGIEGKLLKYTPVGILYDLEMIPYVAFSTLLDEHPDTNARILNQYKYIEAELNKSNLDPKMKKDLQAQLKASKEELDKAKKIGLNGRIVKQFYNLLMIDIFGGDVREAISRIGDPNKDKYNKRADDLLSQIDIK